MRGMVDRAEASGASRTSQSDVDLSRISKPVKTLFGWAVYRRMSAPLSRRLARTSVAPIHLTALGLALGLTGATLLATGRYAWVLAGAALANGAKVLDAVDGEVARAKHLDTPAGYVADGLADQLRDTALIVGAGIGAWRIGEPQAAGWLLGAAVGYLFFFYVASASPAHWREVRSPSDLDDKHMVRVTGDLRLGAGDTIAAGLLASAAIGHVFWLVQAIALLSPLAVLLKVIRLFRRRPWERQKSGQARSP